MITPKLPSIPTGRAQANNNVFGQRPQHNALRLALAYPMVVGPQQNGQRKRKGQGLLGSMFPQAGQLGGF